MNNNPKRKTISLLWETLREEWQIWIVITAFLGITLLFSNQVAEPLTNSAFVKVLDALGKLGVLVAVIAFLREIPKWEERAVEEAKRRQFEYWKAIDAARAGARWDDGRFFSSALRIALESLAQERDTAGNPIKLRNADAAGANLEAINLENADLHVCDFSLADLSLANFRNTKFYQCDLKRARLFGTDFQGADFREVHLRFALYNEETRFPDGFDPDDAMAYKIAPDVSLRGAMLKNATLRSANLEKADLQAANLSIAIIRGGNWKYVNLQDANLAGARAADIDLRWSNLQNANLQGARLQDAKLDGADLRGANLRDAKYITVEQIKASENWEYAIYDDVFRQKLGLPREMMAEVLDKQE
jgi:uncharacterized protein YjbI with pentapeptide repeats